FNDLSVPWHLTTLEFSQRVRDLLTPGDGVYLVNIIDIYPRAKYPAPEDTMGINNIGYLKDPPPQALTPPDWEDRWEDGSWHSAREPFQALQLSRSLEHDEAGRPLQQDEYRLGFRGLMQDKTRNELLEAAGADENLKTAIRELYRRSHAERVGQFLGRYVRTVRDVFPYVYVFTSTDNQGDPGESRDTFIVACSLQKLALDDLASFGGHWSTAPFASSEQDPGSERRDLGEMSSILELSRGLELTDDFAPVDNLLAPVFVSRSKDKD
ncbi:MAG TPA: hypothetical protein VGH74_10580, partial [Planctomycetaceae bacterium]